MASVWGEFKRRNVFRFMIAYAVSVWFLIQVADTIFPLPGLDASPAGSLRLHTGLDS